MAEAGTRPDWRGMRAVFGRIGLMSFGGPAAQIALMHRVLVDQRRWLTEAEFLNALGFCMLLPGPEAMQLATYAGWRQRGLPGGLLAGALFVLPGALVVLALAMAYGAFGALPLVGALFLGVKAAVLIVVIEALLRVARRALLRPAHWAIAAAAFVALFCFALPFPLVIGLAAALGAAMGGGALAAVAPVSVSGRHTLGVVVLGLALWGAPLALFWLIAPGSVLLSIGVFFSKLAVVTFGGAYAVLAYMAQDVVQQLHWLSAGEMLDGLGLAETTPGPLILVTEFVGYLAALRSGGVWMGLAGAGMVLWVTFVPCFLWIFAGAPYLGWIGAQPRLKGALAGITAAVVGVIANLSVWFALHVAFGRVTAEHWGGAILWRPDWASVNIRVIALALLCAVMLLRWHWGIGRVLLIAAALGAVVGMV